jgi:uncharacterized protein
MFGFILLDYWWFAIPGLLLGLWAQIKLTSNYRKYARVPTSNGMTGAQAARAILDQAGLHNMPIGEVGGHLTDHYDPIKKALFLSSENYHGRSISAAGVAAHEAGHALQHKVAYAPLKLRMAIVPVTQFASFAYSGILLLGFLMQNLTQFLGIIIGIFSVITFFQLITLPVEFDASKRAKAQLVGMGLIAREEESAVSKVLNAAALTYVAALVSSVLTLLQYIMLARNRD